MQRERERESTRHVIDQNGDAFRHVPDEDHRVDLVRPFPFLVDQREVNVQPIGDRGDPRRKRPTLPTNTASLPYRLAPRREEKREDHRLDASARSPPASGLTTTAFFESGIWREIQRITAGSAKRLSTGMSKKPWRTARSTRRRSPATDLNLRGMEIHGDDVIRTGHTQHVRHELRRDRGATLGEDR